MAGKPGRRISSWSGLARRAKVTDLFTIPRFSCPIWSWSGHVLGADPPKVDDDTQSCGAVLDRVVGGDVRFISRIKVTNDTDGPRFQWLRHSRIMSRWSNLRKGDLIRSGNVTVLVTCRCWRLTRGCAEATLFPWAKVLTWAAIQFLV